MTIPSYHVTLRILDRLHTIEVRHNITERWKRNDEKYLVHEKCHSRNCREEKKKQMWSAAVKRHFLLRQKSKYAGMYGGVIKLYQWNHF